MDNEILEFPKGHFRTATLTNAAQDVATGAIRMVSFTATGGAAAEIIIFRSADGATEYFRWNLAIATSYHVPKKVYYPLGLEVITASAAGDVQIEIDYVKLSGGD